MPSLKSIYQLVVDDLVNEISRIDLTNVNLYRDWVAQTYFYSSHVEDLLTLFSSCAEIPEVRDRWQAHVGEEQGHEKLALADLKALGCEVRQFREYDSTRRLYEPQVPIAKATAGVGNFGWTIALEGMAANVPGDYLALVVAAHGKKCTRFLELQAQEDPEHIMKALEIAGKMETGRNIIDNIIMTGDAYITMLKDIEKANLR